MPQLVQGKVVQGTGGPASPAQAGSAHAGSAQADRAIASSAQAGSAFASSAQAGSASAGSAQAGIAQQTGAFSLRFAPDAEYNQNRKSPVESRNASGVPRPMPDILVNRNNIPFMQVASRGECPISQLPKTNLAEVTAPPGMCYNDSYQWSLAQLLEGKAACCQPLPTWSHGSVHHGISKFLAYATRHSPEVKGSTENWVSVDWMLENNRHKMATPEDSFQAVFYNEKGRYQFSRPMYEAVTSKRETSMSRVSGQAFYHAKIFIRAYQGHSQSSSPAAALTKIDENNMPNNAVHGTSIAAAQQIVQQGMIPGGDKSSTSSRSSDRQANHFAITLPNDVSHVVSGYRSDSSVCIFLDLASWLEDGYEAFLSPNEVVCIFRPIPPQYFLAAVRISDGFDYLTQALADARLLHKLEYKTLGTDAPVPRMRTDAASSGESMVAPISTDLSNNKAICDVVENAVKEDSPTRVEPTSKLSSVASEPNTKIGQKQTCNLMLNEKVKATLEVALGSSLQDLAGTEGDPKDIQNKIQEKADQNEEQLSAAKQQQQQQAEASSPAPKEARRERERERGTWFLQDS